MFYRLFLILYLCDSEASLIIRRDRGMPFLSYHPFDYLDTMLSWIHSFFTGFKYKIALEWPNTGLFETLSGGSFDYIVSTCATWGKKINAVTWQTYPCQDGGHVHWNVTLAMGRFEIGSTLQTPLLRQGDLPYLKINKTIVIIDGPQLFNNNHSES